MPGLLDLANVDRDQALSGLGQVAAQEQQRNANNDAMKQQAKSNRKQAIGSAVGQGLTMAAMGNPVGGAVVAGLTLLGSLF